MIYWGRITSTSAGCTAGMCMICILDICRIKSFSYSFRISPGVIRINMLFAYRGINSYYTSGQDKLIQNAGGHIHNSSCKKLTCTMYITGKPGNFWISHSDYMEWRYLVCHQNCGRSASEHSANYSKPAGECPCTTYTIPAGSHTYWSCGY